MEMIILLVIVVVVYLLGYITGYRQCEDIMQATIHRIMKDCEEKKIHKCKEPNNLEGELHE